VFDQMKNLRMSQSLMAVSHCTHPSRRIATFIAIAVPTNIITEISSIRDMSLFILHPSPTRVFMTR
jgi:hypothetical protein